MNWEPACANFPDSDRVKSTQNRLFQDVYKQFVVFSRLKSFACPPQNF